MEDILRGLKGKTLTKKKLFDILSDINLELLSGKKESTVVNEIITPIATKKENDFKCDACGRIFTVKGSLKRHLHNSQICVNWISNKIEPVNLERGLHLVIDSILDRAISNNGKLECKWCNVTFTNKGNHHKHYNTSTICNQMAYQEFKKLIISL